MTGARRLGVLGGTFDPIHHGHIDAAEAARVAVALDEIVLVPSHDPPHRPSDPYASAYHRFGLVALAVAERERYRASDVELIREGPSYTIDTLRHFHHCGWPPWQLFFILGSDAFAEIAMWHEYPAVLNAAHFVVITRSGTALDAALARAPAAQARLRPLDAARALDGNDTAVFPVQAVTRDVSSTTIRERLASGQPIDDLVPAAVARHILLHHLYGAAGDLHG